MGIGAAAARGLGGAPGTGVFEMIYELRSKREGESPTTSTGQRTDVCCGERHSSDKSRDDVGGAIGIILVREAVS